MSRSSMSNTPRSAGQETRITDTVDKVASSLPDEAGDAFAPTAMVRAALAAARARQARQPDEQDIADVIANAGRSSRTVNASGSAIPAGSLIFVSASGEETLSELFRYTVRLKVPDTLNLGYFSPAANLSLKDMVGKDINIDIELDDGEKRHINGLVTAAHVLGLQGRSVVYELYMEPWLELATRTSDYKIFQNKTVVEIIDEVLREYPFPMEKRLTETYPKRSFQVQYGETDYTFLLRLMQEFGIYYYFQHSQGEHKLILVDMISSHTPYPGADIVSYHQEGLKLDQEYISSLRAKESLRSGKWVLNDFDFQKPKAQLASRHAMPRETSHANYEYYEWPGDYFDPGEGKFLARVRMEAQRSLGSRVQGCGNVRALSTGYTFHLDNCPSMELNREYLLISTALEVEDIGAHSGEQQHFTYEVSFEVQPTNELFRPQRTITKPHTHGPQSAIVVGPKGEEIWTDQYGRVKVQFLWDRYGEWDENSSCWVRVSQAWAGGRFGGLHLPRIGQEVIVDFKNGDPDLPVITGRMWNADNMADWNLPSHKVLSGFRSKELQGRRSNHLLMDDTPGQIQAQLSSDHQLSQLNLGYITRVPDHTGRKDFRGEGFELRTDAKGGVRAKEGLLITTEAREQAQKHILESAETAGRLSSAHSQHHALAQAARNVLAQTSADQQPVAQALQAQASEIKGHGTTGDKTSFPEFEKPHLVLSSPADIASTSRQTTHLAAGEHIALTSVEHVSTSAGKSFLVAAKEAVKLFAHRAGIKLLSYAEDIDIKALQKNLNLLAKLDITVNAKQIILKGEQEILLNGGDSYIKIASGKVTIGSQVLDIKASLQAGGSDSLPVQLPPINGTDTYEAKFKLVDKVSGNPLVKQPYRIKMPDGNYIYGISDQNGYTDVVSSPDTSPLEIELGGED